MLCSELRQGYIEEYLRQDDDSLIKAYLSIYVLAKSGSEFLSQELKTALKNYRRQKMLYGLGIKDYLKKNDGKSIYISDDMALLYDDKDMYSFAFSLLSELMDTDVMVYFYVDAKHLERFNKALHQACRTIKE